MTTTRRVTPPSRVLMAMCVGTAGAFDHEDVAEQDGGEELAGFERFDRRRRMWFCISVPFGYVLTGETHRSYQRLGARAASA